AITDHNLDILRADIAFLGADAIDRQGAAYSASPELGRLLTRMASVSTQAYIVADSSKIGGHGLMRFAHLRDWSGLITDSELDAATRRQLDKHGVRLLQPARTRRSAHA